jgi:hypothetical protein
MTLDPEDRQLKMSSEEKMCRTLADKDLPQPNCPSKVIVAICHPRQQLQLNNRGNSK